MRRLIVNADDFGLTAGVNRAIVEASSRGLVTSTTLMANARAFAEAAELAREFAASGARLSVGCHVMLVDGEPLLPPHQIESLLEPETGLRKRRLRDKLGNFAVRAISGRLKAAEIEAEAIAQMQRIQQAGIRLSHFDTHKHTHMFPVVLGALLRAARLCGVRAVRNPFEALLPLPLRFLRERKYLWTRFAEISVLRTLGFGLRRRIESHGLRTTDGSLGVLVTGSLDLELFLETVENVPEGTWEFVCHPGYDDADLAQVRTRLRQSRVQELAVLTSSEAREALSQKGIQLISYHEL